MKVIGAYIVRQYVRVFAFLFCAGLAVFAVVDVVGRVADYAQYGPSVTSMLAFYALRLPLLVTNIFPAVCLLSVLISLGLLVRNREVIAMRACGLSDWQIAAPLVLVSTLLGVAAFFWNEIVVPQTAAEARRVKDVLVKGNRDLGAYDARSMWLQSPQGFVNIEYFDAVHDVIHGLTLYTTDPTFRLRRILEAPTVSWLDGAWRASEGSVKEIGEDGSVRSRSLEAGDLQLSDRPSVLANRRPHAEEFTFAELRERIALLQAKGLNVDELRVDWHAKLAIPFSAVVSLLFGFPLAIRGGRRFGLGYNVGVGLLTGFLYWATLAFAVSAGRIGALPPIVAAWSANVVFGLAGVAMLRTSD